MIRLVAVGDIHLRAGEHLDDVLRCLDYAAEVADERDAHGVLIAGDVFEGKSTPVERAAFGRFLERIAASRPVVIIKGNHDQAEDLAVFDPYEYVTVCERPEIIQVRHPRSLVEVGVLCVPWPERSYLASMGYTGEAGERAGSAALAAMLRGMVAARTSPHPLVVLGHLQVLGAQTSSAQPLIGKAIEAVLGDLQDLGAAAVVLGHVHKPQELAPNVHYCGSLTCHDFGEESEQKRIGILSVDGDGSASWEWIPVPCRRWVTIEACISEPDADGSGGGLLLERSPREAWADAFDGRDFAGENLRYRYSCSEEDAGLFDHAAIERRFANAHSLKIVAEIERAQRVRAAEVAAARTTEEKLRAWGAATGQEITESLVDKLHALEEK